MQAAAKFPLLSGNLSIDLINTEVVGQGQRLDLLPHTTHITHWLQAVQERIPLLGCHCIIRSVLHHGHSHWVLH